MAPRSEGGKAKTLHIKLSVYPCGNADPEKNLTISCFGSIDLKNAKIGVIEKRPPSSLVFFSEGGRPIWKAP